MLEIIFNDFPNSNFAIKKRNLVCYDKDTIYNMHLKGKYIHDIYIELVDIKAIEIVDDKVFILSKENLYYYKFGEQNLHKLLEDVNIFKKTEIGVLIAIKNEIHLLNLPKTKKIFYLENIIIDFAVFQNNIYVLSKNQIFKFDLNSNVILIIEYLSYLSICNIASNEYYLMLENNSEVIFITKEEEFFYFKKSLDTKKISLIKKFMYVFEEKKLEIYKISKDMVIVQSFYYSIDYFCFCDYKNALYFVANSKLYKLSFCVDSNNFVSLT